MKYLQSTSEQIFFFFVIMLPCPKNTHILKKKKKSRKANFETVTGGNKRGRNIAQSYKKYPDVRKQSVCLNGRAPELAINQQSTCE